MLMRSSNGVSSYPSEEPVIIRLEYTPTHYLTHTHHTHTHTHTITHTHMLSHTDVCEYKADAALQIAFNPLVTSYTGFPVCFHTLVANGLSCTQGRRLVINIGGAKIWVTNI